MAQTLANGIVVPTNPDAFSNLTADLATMGNSANVVIQVASQSARDALTKKAGLTVTRTDLPGSPIETCDGTNWATQQVPKVWANTAHAGAAPTLSNLQSGATVPIIQCGTNVVTPDVNGYFSIVLPQAFPNSLITADAICGDNSVANGQRLLITLGSAAPTTAQVNFRVWDTGANAAYGSSNGSVLLRADWKAYGT